MKYASRELRPKQYDMKHKVHALYWWRLFPSSFKTFLFDLRMSPSSHDSFRRSPKEWESVT